MNRNRSLLAYAAGALTATLLLITAWAWGDNHPDRLGDDTCQVQVVPL